MDIRERISKTVLSNFNPPDAKHSSWWLNPDHIADEILTLLGAEYQYAVSWGDDSSISHPSSREQAERRMSKDFGDKLVIRQVIRFSETGEWEETE